MRLVLLALLFPFVASASGGGDWQSSGVGASLSYRGIESSSTALKPPVGVSGTVTLVAWRYQLLTQGPAGLVVSLCSGSRCVELDGPSGTTRALAGVPASQPLHFVWQVRGRGGLYPPVRVISNQVIVNYRPPSPMQ